MSKGDHRLLQLLHKQLKIIESLINEHFESTSDFERLELFKEEMGHLYEIIASVDEKIRELSLFRGMVATLRKANINLREQQKYLEHKREIQPLQKHQLVTKRMDILKKKDLDKRQKIDANYLSKEEDDDDDGKKVKRKFAKQTRMDKILKTKAEPKKNNPEKVEKAEEKKNRDVTGTFVLPLKLKDENTLEELENFLEEKEDKNFDIEDEIKTESENESKSTQDQPWPEVTEPIAFDNKEISDNELNIELELPVDAINSKIPIQKLGTELDNIEEFLHEREVLSLLQISQKKLNFLIEKGKIKYFEDLGQRLFYGTEIKEILQKVMEIETIAINKKEDEIKQLKKIYRDRIR